MPRRLFLALILLVAAPLVLLGWVSASAVRSSQESAKENLAKLLSTQLYDTDRQIVFMFERYAATLSRDIETAPSLIPALKRLRRNYPIVRQGVFVDPRGLILFPSPSDSPDIDAVEVAATLPAMIDARPFPSDFSDATQLGVPVQRCHCHHAQRSEPSQSIRDNEAAQVQVFGQLGQ